MLTQGVDHPPAQQVKGGGSLLHSRREEGPDIRYGRDPCDVDGEQLVVPEELVVGQEPGDPEVDGQDRPEDPAAPGVQGDGHGTLQTIQ
jgi:hypothetical protein